MSNSKPTHELHFVIGGAGFLGSHIIRALVQRGETAVASFDIREPEERIQGAVYYEGDLTDAKSLSNAIQQAQDDTKNSTYPKRSVAVYHTASPVAGLGPSVYEKVNVTGTNVVIEVCRAKDSPVTKLIFTSSAGVVFSGKDLVYVDERLGYPTDALDAYNDTKARAEAAVLAANSDDGLKTVALRPAGIFGPGDRQALPGFFQVLENKRTKWQIGNNENLFDWTYVGNVAHAHLLASDCLGVSMPNAKPPSAYPASDLVDEHLPSTIGEIDKAHQRAVPTSVKRQDVAAPARDYCRDVQPLIDMTKEPALDLRPVARNRFDPLYHHAFPKAVCGGNPRPDVMNLAHEHLQAAGEAFFITNGQPMPFWDFPRALWHLYNGHVDPPSSLIVIPLWLALVLASLAEVFSMLTGRKVQFTRYRVTYTACARYYNIEKARRVLGYEPIYGMEEALQLSALWWKSQHPVISSHPNETAKTK